MIWLKDYAPKVTSYCEIRYKWGTSLIVTCEWLRLNGAPLSKVTALELTPPSPLLESYLVTLHQSGIEIDYLQESTQRAAVQAFVAQERPQIVHINGTRTLKSALVDHQIARSFARIIVHQDISSDNYPEIGNLWENLEALETDRFQLYTFAGQDVRYAGRRLGLGALVLKGWASASVNP